VVGTTVMLTLPAAMPGNGSVTYALTPALPGGLTFAAGTRVISGMPTTAAAAQPFTYTATDEDGDVAPPLTFDIEIEADTEPNFTRKSVVPQIYTEGLVSKAVKLPEAASGNKPLTYSMKTALPSGLAFDAEMLQISGTPAAGTATTTAAEYKLVVTDKDGDPAELTFSITTIRAAATTMLTLSHRELELQTASSSDNRLALTSSVSWAATVSGSWIMGPTPNTGGAGSAQNLVFSYSVNNTGALRTGMITFTETTVGANPPLPEVAVTLRQGATVLPGGLIPVRTLEQLNVIRYDLDADGKTDDGVSTQNSLAFAQQFPNLSALNTYEGYQLMRDLDFDDDDSYSAPSTNKPTWTMNSGWTPIGRSSRFTGVFDGGGHTISNLFINNSTESASLGLFGFVSGSSAVIRQVGLMGPSVTGGANTQIGGLVGSQNGGTISNCYVSDGSSTGGGTSTVGGLAGNIEGSRIDSCYVSGRSSTGGAASTAGGLVGTMNNSMISACYVSGGTTSASSFAGGLVGKAGNTVLRVGGGTITACYVSNNAITGGSARGLIAFIADDGQVTACYAGRRDYTNLISGRATVTNSYYQAASSSGDANKAVQAKTQSALQTPTSSAGIFADWDSNQWDFGTSRQYPVLKIDFNGNGTADDIVRQRK